MHRIFLKIKFPKTLFRSFLIACLVVGVCFSTAFASSSVPKNGSPIGEHNDEGMLLARQDSVHISPYSEIEEYVAQIVKTEVEKLNQEDLEYIALLKDFSLTELADLMVLSDKELQMQISSDKHLEKVLKKFDTVSEQAKFLGFARRAVNWFLGAIPKILSGITTGGWRGGISGITNPNIETIPNISGMATTHGCYAGLGNNVGSIGNLCRELGNFVRDVVDATIENS